MQSDSTIPAVVYFEAAALALDATGIPWKRGQRETGHWIINAPSNLKPWTIAEAETLWSAVAAAGFKVTHQLVDAHWNEYQAHPQRQFRIHR